MKKLFRWMEAYRWQLRGYRIAVVDVLAFLWVITMLCFLIAVALFLWL